MDFFFSIHWLYIEDEMLLAKKNSTARTYERKSDK